MANHKVQIKSEPAASSEAFVPQIITTARPVRGAFQTPPGLAPLLPRALQTEMTAAAPRAEMPGQARGESWWYRGANLFNSVSIQTFWFSRSRAGQVTGPAVLANQPPELETTAAGPPVDESRAERRLHQKLIPARQRVIDKVFQRQEVSGDVPKTHVLFDFEDKSLCQSIWDKLTAQGLLGDSMALLPPDMVTGIQDLMSDQPTYASAFSLVCFDVQIDSILNPDRINLDWPVLTAHCQRKDLLMIQRDPQARSLTEPISADIPAQNKNAAPMVTDIESSTGPYNHLFQDKAALAILEKCAQLPPAQFAYFAAKLGFAEDTITPLRRYLQARSHIRTESDASPTKKTLAVRVFEQARKELMQYMELNFNPELDILMEVDADDNSVIIPRFNFDSKFWDEDYRSDDEIDEIRQLFYKWMDDEHHDRGLAQNISEFGLSGADRQLLSTEIKAVLDLRENPILQDAVGVIEHDLHLGLNLSRSENSDVVVGHRKALNRDPLHLKSAQMLVDFILLQTWKTSHLQRFDFIEMVHGKALCEDVDIEQGSDFESVARPVFDQYRQCHGASVPEATYQAFEDKVKKKLSQSKIGLSGIYDLFNKYGVEATHEQKVFFKKVHDLIDGKSSVSAGNDGHIGAVGKIISKMLGQVYFGNFITMLEKFTHGFSPNRIGININISKNRALNIQGGIKNENTKAPVYRSGALNHGVEPVMIAKQGEKLRGGTLGCDYGYVTNNLPVFDFLKFRFLSGAAVGITCRKTVTDGVMLRAGRRVVLEQDHPVNPVFDQNDEQIRLHSAQVQEILSEGAEGATDDAHKERTFVALIEYCQKYELSISKTHQESTVWNCKFSLRVTGSLQGTTTNSEGVQNGVRGHFSKSLDIEKESQAFSQIETRGSHRVNQVRCGEATRFASTALCGLNTFVGSTFIQYSHPVTERLMALITKFKETDWSQQCRLVFDQGMPVPEKSFFDTSTHNYNEFKKILYGNGKKAYNEICEKFYNKWMSESRLSVQPGFVFNLVEGPPLKLICTQGGVADAEAAERHTNKQLDDSVADMKMAWKQNHNAYVRARMHPDAADFSIRTDLLLKVINPTILPEFLNEVRSLRNCLLDHAPVFLSTSIVGDESIKNEHSSPELNVFGFVYKWALESIGQREHIFTSPGWAWLRQWERENPLNLRQLMAS
jgi:hypothetical protein